MSDISHSILTNQYSDSQSVIYRTQYFLMKKTLSVLGGTPSAAEKEIAKATLTGNTGSVLNMSYPSLFISSNPNIEAAVAAGTVSAITDEDYIAAADTIWEAFVTAYT